MLRGSDTLDGMGLSTEAEGLGRQCIVGVVGDGCGRAGRGVVATTLFFSLLVMLFSALVSSASS